MTADYKMKYLEDLKSKTSKKLESLKMKIYAKPLGEIFELLKQAKEISERNGKDYAKTAKEIEPLCEKEKELRKLLNWQEKNLMKALDEQVELETVIADINNELFYLKIRVGRKEL